MVSYTRYWVVSAAAASAVLYHAFATRQHFYPTALYLSTSKLAVAVVGNLAFATALLLHKALIKIFLGSLRDIEQELIRERLSSAIMESLLALTIFREEFSGFFVAMFAGLVFVKVLHWLVQDRVDYIEVTPSVSRLQHLRIVAFMTVLLALDALLLQYTVSATIASGGQSVMLLFAFEYVIQASDVIRYFVKYLLSMLDLWLEGCWEGKGTYVFYLDLITDLLHLFVYIVFFVIVFTNYGLPLHLVRDLYSTFRNFRNRVMDFLRFRQVSARLHRLPDASADDLARSDGVCIICREEMTASGSNKKLSCGHVFHMHCLRSWLERQQNCPTCRGPVFQRRDAAAAAPAARAVPAAPAAAPAAAGAAQPAAGNDPAVGAGAVAGDAGAGGPGGGPGVRPHGIHVHHHRVRLMRPPRGSGGGGGVEGAGETGGAAAGAGPPNPFIQLAGMPVPPPPGAAFGLPHGWGMPVGGQPQGQDAMDLHTLNLAAMMGRGFNPMGMPGMGLMPMFPTLMPPLTPPPNPNSVLEQQAAAAAAAAALAAAAAVGAYNPLGGLLWLPAPQPEATSGQTAATSSPPEASPTVDTDALTRLGQLAAELNTVLTEVNQAKQQALAKQVAEQMQAAVMAAQAVLAGQGTEGPFPTVPVMPVPAPSPPSASSSAPAPLSSSPAAASSSTAPTTSATQPSHDSPAVLPEASTVPPAVPAPSPMLVEPEQPASTEASTSSTVTAADDDAPTSTSSVAELDPQEEMRRKRLAHFQQQA